MYVVLGGQSLVRNDLHRVNQNASLALNKKQGLKTSIYVQILIQLVLSLSVIQLVELWLLGLLGVPLAGHVCINRFDPNVLKISIESLVNRRAYTFLTKSKKSRY